ncbi:DUF4367 domain-containing protein [Halovenus salina]|uniref:DUF4367 domain-containing protein n=1 Tax=Halovenus salina TaxID=1510225 RepID=A0ABD5W700_9EURY
MEDAEGTATVYVDRDTYFPVQVVSQTSSEDFAHTSTVTYENITLDVEIPDETFELNLPDDVNEQETSMPDVSRHDSYDSLISDTNLAVPSADLPSDFRFDRGVVFENDDYHSVSLTYTDGEESVTVTARGEAISNVDHSDSDRYEAVDVGDTTGYVYTNDDFLTLYIEADQPYSIYGEIGEDTAVSIAEAIVNG